MFRSNIQTTSLSGQQITLIVIWQLGYSSKTTSTDAYPALGADNGTHQIAYVILRHSAFFVIQTFRLRSGLLQCDCGVRRHHTYPQLTQRSCLVC